MSANASNRNAAYSKQKSAEEAEVDALIQQLEVSPSTATSTAGESSKELLTKDDQQPLHKHGKRHLIGKAAPPGAPKPAFVNAKKEAAVTKNSRKPRNGLGRGLPKKGGGGGKGVWGKPGDELIDYEEDLLQEPEDEPDDYDTAQMQKVRNILSLFSSELIFVGWQSGNS